MSDEKIVIAGAGLVGSLMAIYLARRDLTVDVYEKRGDMRRETVDAGRSINLALANRGIAALEGAGVMDSVRPLLIPMKGRMLHDEAGRLDFQAYGKRPDEVIHSVSRSELNCRLMDAAEETGRVRFHFNHSLKSVDFEQRHIKLHDNRIDMGYHLDCDRLIATDGAGSPTRQAMQAHLNMDVNEDILGHGYKELTIPGTSEGGWRMDTDALHIWPRGGHMLIALPNLDGSFTVTLFLPYKGDPSFDTIGEDPERIRNFFRTHFADAMERMPTLVDDFLSNPLGKLGTVRCPHWRVDDFALLLGDAAHAIVPFHGQGMNCGFEDCRELDRALEEADGDWGRAFELTEQRRRPNAEAIADMALENYVEMRDSVRDPVFKLKKQLGWQLEDRYPDRFIPRYSMVMFHHLPYAEAQSRGRIQAEIMDELLKDANSLDQVDMERVETLIHEKLLPVDEG